MDLDVGAIDQQGVERAGEIAAHEALFPIVLGRHGAGQRCARLPAATTRARSRRDGWCGWRNRLAGRCRAGNRSSARCAPLISRARAARKVRVAGVFKSTLSPQPAAVSRSAPAECGLCVAMQHGDGVETSDDRRVGTTLSSRWQLALTARRAHGDPRGGRLAELDPPAVPRVDRETLRGKSSLSGRALPMVGCRGYYSIGRLIHLFVLGRSPRSHGRAIGFDRRQVANRPQASATFQAENPAAGKALPDVYPVSGWQDCEAALAAAAVRLRRCGACRPMRLGDFSGTVRRTNRTAGGRTGGNGPSETALPQKPRLADVELPRTTSQLRQAAAAAREGSWALPTIDTKLTFALVICRSGRCAVFGPNNFPSRSTA